MGQFVSDFVHFVKAAHELVLLVPLQNENGWNGAVVHLIKSFGLVVVHQPNVHELQRQLRVVLDEIFACADCFSCEWTPHLSVNQNSGLLFAVVC